MLIIRQDTGINYNSIAEKFKGISFDKALFFDIETTGFAAKNTKLYLIGCVYADASTGNFTSIQWFLDDYNDEGELIKAFTQFSKDFDTLIHFNGQGFDIPYVEAKCQKYNISFDFSAFNHIDLYKYASKLKIYLKPRILNKKLWSNSLI